MMHSQFRNRGIFGCTGHLLMGMALLVSIGCTTRTPPPPTRATPAQVQGIEAQITAREPVQSASAHLETLLTRIVSTQESKRPALIEEYLHGAYQLRPEEREPALQKLQDVLRKRHRRTE